MFLTQRNWSELFELPVKEIHSHGLQQERNVLGLCVTVLGRNGFWALVDPGSNSSPPHRAHRLSTSHLISSQGDPFLRPSSLGG